MQRNRCQRAVADVVMLVALEFRSLNVCCEQRDAFRGFHASEPDKRQSSSIQRAIFRSDANAVHLLRFQPKEHDKPPRSFELDAALRVCGAARCVTILLEAAGSTASFVAPIAATHTTFAGSLIDAVSDPFGLFGLREDSAEGGIQGSRNRTSFRFGAFDAWHLCARLCRCGIGQAWAEIRSQGAAFRKLRYRPDDPHENHRQSENSSCDTHSILRVHLRVHVAPHFCKSSIK